MQIYSRTEASAGALAQKLCVPYTTDVDRIVKDADLYIISVSDDAIEPLIDKIHLPHLPDRMVVHTAGSVPMDVFAGKFTNYGVLYPLQTFSKSSCTIKVIDTPLFIEANTPDNLTWFRGIVGAVSNHVYCISSAERMQLHLAAVFGCNFVNHLYHLSVQLARQVGVNFDTLAPMFLETTRKVIASGNPQQVQTGPAVRGDHKVTDKHLELLATCPNPKWKALYALLSESIEQTKREQEQNKHT